MIAVVFWWQQRQQLFLFISDPTTREALAAWSATTLARELGLHKVVLEGDCQPVIAAICLDSFSWNSWGQIIHDIKSLLGFFRDSQVCHVRRSANQAAHLMAKAALNLSMDCV